MDAISRYYALRKQSRILRRGGSLQKQEQLQEEQANQHPSHLSCPILRYDSISFQLKRILAIQNRHTTPIIQTTSLCLSPKTVKHTMSAQATTTTTTISTEANSLLKHKDQPHHCRHRSVAAALA